MRTVRVVAIAFWAAFHSLFWAPVVFIAPSAISAVAAALASVFAGFAAFGTFRLSLWAGRAVVAWGVAFFIAFMMLAVDVSSLHDIWAQLALSGGLWALIVWAMAAHTNQVVNSRHRPVGTSGRR